MVKAGKMLALIGGILTFVGVFFFSLYTDVSGYNYGIVGAMAILDLLSGSGWQLLVFSIFYILYLLSFILILIGIKSRVLAIIGSLFPLAILVIVLLGAFNLWAVPFHLLVDNIGAGGMPQLAGIFPFSFDALIVANIDLGTWIVGLGALLALISGFISRED
ncbi:MAG: hypothetical protein ACTSR4_04885 [Candidatus Hodarchaeales archaeon]